MLFHNRQDVHILPTLRESDRVAPALRRGKRGIDGAFAFINRPFVAQRIGQLGKDLPQHLLVTPLLEATVDGFVIRIALGEQMPLGPGVQNPERGLQDGTSRHRFAARANVWEVFLRKMLPDPLPSDRRTTATWEHIYGRMVTLSTILSRF